MAALMNRILLILFLFTNIQLISQNVNEYFYINTEDGNIRITNNEIKKFLNQKIIELENLGYPFVEVKLENIKNNTADLLIKKGEQYRLDSLVIYGDNKITTKQLYNLIDLKKGEVYSQHKIDNISEIFKHDENYNQTKSYEIVFHKNTFDIYFYLDKISKNNIDALIGFNSENGKIKINGHLTTKIQNIFNFEEVININWSSQQEKFQKFNSKLQLPRVLNSRIGITSELKIHKKHEEFMNIQTIFSAEYLTMSNCKIKLLYHNKNSTSEQISLQESKTKSVGLGLDFNRNNWTICSENYFGNRKYPDKKFRHINTNFYLEYIYKIFNKNSIILTNNTQLIFSSNLQENEKLFFGGSNTLKGFLNDEFTSTKFSIFSANMKYNLDSKTYAILFIQQALYREQNETIQANSFGIGTEIKNKTGLVYIQYAIGISEYKSFNIKNGVIHIGLKNTF
ncbi:MAG: hypothetical protein CMD02_00150 [Flavobacteriales bacterium]|nr:hypothetical protein [Flavobacteriales bacterium]